ncbi:MAG: 30S ribosomal protein S5 [Proteobacteria bacterium]|jgi:small subunit ribosomal protein S5|nr:30S ribosomal protein S5 [Pseudomonadota bacterium]
MAFKDTLDKRRVTIDQCGELTDKTVFVNRVSKVVKGGRRFSFSALVVTGDGRGHIGFGLGKSAEVPEAIRKASEQARKRLIKVPLKGSTIPHDVLGKAGPSDIVMKPAAPGTGVIAGASVRAVMDVCGIKDIRTKCLGSTTPQNVIQATIAGFLMLEEPEVVASMRGIKLEDMGYHPY